MPESLSRLVGPPGSGLIAVTDGGAYGPLAMFGVIAAALLMSLVLIAGGPLGLARKAIE